MTTAASEASNIDGSSRTRRKVLMVTAWPPQVQAGGVSTVIRTLAAERSAEFDYDVLVNDWDAKQLRRDCGSFPSYRLRMRLPYDRSKPLVGVLGWIRDLPSTLIQLRRLIRMEGIALVHIHYPSAYQFYIRVLRLFGGPPYVATLHRGETVNFGELSAVDKMLTLWTMRGAARVVAVSNWLADLARRTFSGIDNIGCIYNGLDLSEFDEIEDAGATAPLSIDLSSECDLPSEYCLIVANLTFFKGQDVAIEAWSKLRERLPNLHLVIVGDRRDHWDTCARLIEQLGCGDRIQMIGPVQRSDVLKLMKRATALIFPSRNEGLGLVMLEAGAAGLPVICSRIGPFMEIARDEESALMVEPEDSAALAEAVVRLAGDPALRRRLGDTLRRRVHEQFSADTMASRYEDLYRAALGGSTAGEARRTGAYAEDSRSS